ncbi:hypothetical protein GCM10007853_04480 [Algimonas ampicilliniresistens]|uniref:Recombinase family protein n=1 Tax=Algimonas ampicilliniresistens TaxID=1298735 RepID=A0ABQ5V772_9PROT|nr:recombinase family protein [Algimonas ampicilliniresistens]GLQ22574.1 hypothetical protein GCM10007853_04480 [Algimonas ampicilliniresistens]
MTTSAPTTLRCAVYTRKSHEEGLDQDFNSLDAQTEACRAYILSQAGLGWQLRDGEYSDAGISGGHMDRQGLQRLISDIEAGLIDVVVVYKVDRLTRSLSDFSRLVETFDQHQVSFVSVTQAFNTTTSMGRLTLNVLLSFAQFEREVTAERIRDKIAASKAKGIWMGGLVPLGYRSKNRKLIIEERGEDRPDGWGEAETVRAIFSLYLRLKSVRQVKEALDREGALSKRRVTKTGKVSGGKPFFRGHIYTILKNPIYVGKIVHKGEVYDGEHDAIIDQETWDRTQALLRENAPNRMRRRYTKTTALLAGLLEDADGHPLVPQACTTRGVKYHYYVSRRLKTGDVDSGWRLRRDTIESTVLTILKGHFADDLKLFLLLRLDEIDVTTRQTIMHASKLLAAALAKPTQELMHQLVERIVLEANSVTIQLSKDGLLFHLPIDEEPESWTHSNLLIQEDIVLRRRGQETKLVLGAKDEPAFNPDEALIHLIARATLLREQLESGEITSLSEFAEVQGLDPSNMNKLVPLGYLAPSILDEILEGRQPEHMSSRSLQRMTDLPLEWDAQRNHLGMHSASPH